LDDTVEAMTLATGTLEGKHHSRSVLGSRGNMLVTIGAPHIEVVQHFDEELKRLVPTK
jgi:hypothetical protein